MGTGPAGRTFPIIMGLLGSVLVLALIICLAMSVLGAPPASYSYNSQYTGQGPRPSDYGSTQGGDGYADQGGLGEGGANYGAENFSEGFGPNSLGDMPQSGVGVSPGPGTYNTQYTGTPHFAPEVSFEGTLEGGRDVAALAGQNEDLGVSSDHGALTGYDDEGGLLQGGAVQEHGAEDAYPYPHPYGQPYGSDAGRHGFEPTHGDSEYDGYTRDTIEYDSVHHGNQFEDSYNEGISRHDANQNVRGNRSVQFVDGGIDQRLSALASVANDQGGTVGLVDRGDYYYNVDRNILSTSADDNEDADLGYSSSRHEYGNGDVYSSLRDERNDTMQEDFPVYGDPVCEEEHPPKFGQNSDDDDMSGGEHGDERLGDEDLCDNDQIPLEDEPNDWTDEQNHVRRERSDIGNGDEMKENSVPTGGADSARHKHLTHISEPEAAYVAEDKATKPVVFGERVILGDSDWQLSQRENTGGHKRPNPDYDYLRKLREPYVKSVAGRLSTGALSCTTAMAVDPQVETGDT